MLFSYHLGKFFKYNFLHALYILRNSFSNNGAYPSTWALRYITQGFHPFYHTMKIQQIHHGNSVFLQVFAYQYHKDLGATDKPNLTGLKNL